MWLLDNLAHIILNLQIAFDASLPTNFWVADAYFMELHINNNIIINGWIYKQVTKIKFRH